MNFPKALFAIVVFVLGMATRSAPAESLNLLAPAPDWNDLESLQRCMTRREFAILLESVYAPGGAARGLIEIRDDHAEIVTDAATDGKFILHFAEDAGAVRPVPRFWRTPSELPAASRNRPLEGLRIALDPGHLGGDYARMEGRWFQLEGSQPVTEGDMTLRTAELLERRLKTLGATVSFVRHAPGPVTEKRPADFRPEARRILQSRGITQPRETYESFNDSGRDATVQFQSEYLFFRISEIRHRATLVNDELRPDLVVCLHFDATSWDDPAQPTFSQDNHFHVLVNGCYSADELALDDARHDMLVRLLEGTTRPEQAVATHVAKVMARRLALPPMIYRGSNACRVNENPYVWARNLLANRVYRCPVLFLEPHVMNNRETWERVQAGDYEGEKLVAGSLRPSLYCEYADAVAEALASFYRDQR